MLFQFASYLGDIKGGETRELVGPVFHCHCLTRVWWPTVTFVCRHNHHASYFVTVTAHYHQTIVYCSNSSNVLMSCEAKLWLFKEQSLKVGSQNLHIQVKAGRYQRCMNKAKQGLFVTSASVQWFLLSLHAQLSTLLAHTWLSVTKIVWTRKTCPLHSNASPFFLWICLVMMV